MTTLSFRLKPTPPFRLDLTVWALRRMPHNAIDVWDGQRYSRAFFVENKPVKVVVEQKRTAENPLLQVTLFFEYGISEVNLKKESALLLEKTLSLRKDLQDFYIHPMPHKNIRALVEAFKGVKPPRFPSIFEALLNAFACQQVSLNVGITLLNRLAAHFGSSLPSPETLSRTRPGALKALGFSGQKERAMVTLAREVVEGSIALESVAQMDDEAAAAYLQQIKGIGRWSAEYVLLRGLGRINIFPSDDVGAQRSIQNFLHLKEKPDPERIRQITRAWQPYAGFIYFHFLLAKLRAKGYIVESGT